LPQGLGRPAGSAQQAHQLACERLRVRSTSVARRPARRAALLASRALQVSARVEQQALLGQELTELEVPALAQELLAQGPERVPSAA
jgi:hypothetical protein